MAEEDDGTVNEKIYKRVSSKNRKSYNLTFIKEALDLYDKTKQDGVKNIQNTVAAQLGVAQGTFAGWLKLRDVYEDKIKNATELQLLKYQGKGNCHTPFYPEEEARLRDLILERRANDIPCSGDFIRATMNQFVKETHDRNPDVKVKSFNASHNWLTRFSQRMNMPNRKGPIPGTTSRKNPRAEQSVDPMLLVESGRKRRKAEHPSLPHTTASASSSSSARAKPKQTHAAGGAEGAQFLLDMNRADSSDSDDDAAHLEPMHNIELLLQQKPISNFTTTSAAHAGVSSGLASAVAANILYDDAIDQCLNVIVNRDGGAGGVKKPVTSVAAAAGGGGKGKGRPVTKKMLAGTSAAAGGGGKV